MNQDDLKKIIENDEPEYKNGNLLPEKEPPSEEEIQEMVKIIKKDKTEREEEKNGTAI